MILCALLLIDVVILVYFRTPGTTPKTRLPSTTEEPEEYEPQVDFKPVIPLPEEVQVVTGEEDEEVLWEDRAKLFRYITNQQINQSYHFKDKNTTMYDSTNHVIIKKLVLKVATYLRSA